MVASRVPRGPSTKPSSLPPLPIYVSHFASPHILYHRRQTTLCAAQHNFTLVVLAIVLVSVLPIAFELLAARREQQLDPQ